MYLKSIIVQGFKSFPDKTVINFTDGITAIVGPNGSGKSNIVDAIRWVLGEQSSKTLRGSKMEDVIFNGTSLRKQSGFAEVTLCIDNADGALPVDLQEVAVTRRLYRSGESEYLICDKPTRLKDITELFMNTGIGRDGYSIIGQGKIAEVLSAKSDERRSIFEEAAGISKYRYRKNEAERKLASTQDNLLRVHDILNELENRIGPLKIQSEKAKAFLAYSGEKKQLEINVWLDSVDKTNETKAAIAEKLATAQAEFDRVTAQYDNDLARAEALTEDAQGKYVELDSLNAEIKLCKERLSLISTERAVKENDVLHERDYIKRINETLSQGKNKEEDYDRQVEAKRAEQDSIRQRLAQNNSSLQAVIEENENQLACQSGLINDANRLTAEIALVTGNLTDKKIELAAYANRLENQADKISQIDSDIESKQAQIDAQREQMRGAKEEYEQCRERIDENENIIAGYRKKAEAKRAQLEALLEKIRRAENEIVQKNGKINMLTDMEQHFEGFAGSVKSVMREAARGRLKNIHGTVNDLISVKPEYSVAIEIALGGAIQNIVVDNENDAKAAIMLLKRENLGRATFLPISSVKGALLDVGALKKEEGYVGIASQLIDFDKKYDGIFASLLGRVAIAQTIDDAIRIARANSYKFKIVTLDGQVVNYGGSLTGGSQGKGSGVLSRKNDIALLKEEVEKLTANNNATVKEADKLRSEVAAIDASLDGAVAELNVARENIIRAEGTVNQYKALISALNEAIDGLDDEKTALISGGTEARLRSAALEKELSALEAKLAALSLEFDSVTRGQEEAAKAREELTAKIAEMKLLTVSLEKDIETAEGIIAKIYEEKRLVQSELLNSSAEIENANARIAALTAEIDGYDAQTEAFNAEIADTNRKIEETNKLRNDLERQARELRDSCKSVINLREGLLKEVERCQSKKEQIDGEYDNIIARLWDEYELTLTDAYALRTELENLGAAQKRIAELRSKIKNLGAVNVDAIQEYREVKERYDFLKEQVDDLERAKADLETLITNLTAEMRKIFAEQFRVIRENFSIVFTELFGGGKATLELTDPTDALESGIDIAVSPPGKVIKNLSALSGGEQALTAISLYFAIMKVRPAPFCLLDEIDAPLDDVNVTRLAAYMKRMTEKSQYICITHKRGMMESADILYGVTMQERGVTKLLTINVADVEKKFGNKLG